MKIYEIFINGRYVDSIEASSADSVKTIAKKHFGVPVTVKVRRNG